MITKALIALLAIFIVPELLGMLVLRFWKEHKNNIILAFILGYIIEFAIGEFVSIPLMLNEGSLTGLVKVYATIIGVITIISFFINIWRIIEILKDLISNIKTMPILLSILLVVLVGMQLLVFVKYGHINDDDAYYVATATTSVQTDTLFKYSAMTGTDEIDEQYLMRYRLGPFPIYYAIMSKVIDIHPAIVAHFILPLIFTPLVYMIYWLFAKEFFKENKKSAVLFMIFICLLHIFSYYSGKNIFILALLRIWQGKSVLATIILPLIILLFIYGEKDNLKFINCIAIFLTVLAGNFTTTMAIALAPACLMIISAVFEFVKLISKQTKVINAMAVIVKSLICCTPSFVYGLMYFQNYVK